MGWPAHCDSSSIRARHLLRALLREATYLPDDAARIYTHRRILSRFRDYRPNDASLTEARLAKLFENGEQQLRFLKRANNGERSVLLKVLEHTYGRTGRRKHELMKPLMQANELPIRQNHSQGEPSARDGIRPLDLPKGVSGPTITAKGQLKFSISNEYTALRATILSQATRQTKRDRVSTDKVMDGHNVWGRPMPRKRQQNFAKRWWADTLSKVSPPLPDEERTRLKHKASNRTSWLGAPKRRASTGQQSKNMSIDTLQKMVKFGGTDRLTSSEFLLQDPNKSRNRLRPQPQESIDVTIDIGPRKSSSHSTKRAHHEEQLFSDPVYVRAQMDLILEDGMGVRSINKKLANAKDDGHALRGRFMQRLFQNI